MDTNDKLRKRVAELESDVASIGGALQYAERKIRQMEVDENRDDCRMALNKARRVVEHERKLAAAQDVWDRIGEIRRTRVCPARYDAAWCPFGRTLPCDRHNPDLSDEAARGQNAPCWLAHYGFASEYADACELWARADAAKGADDRYEQQQQPDRARNDG